MYTNRREQSEREELADKTWRKSAMEYETPYIIIKLTETPNVITISPGTLETEGTDDGDGILFGPFF